MNTQRIKQLIKGFIPPVMLRFYRTRGRRYGFSGNYPNWDTAARLCTGYDAAIILERVKAALWLVKTGQALYERDSVLFDHVEYSWPLLAGLLRVAGTRGNRLSVLDFGGSLGSTYFQCRGFLADLAGLRWNIVEQSRFVRIGREMFEDEHLKFYYDIASCLRDDRPDIALFSSVIQYLQEPYALLAHVIDTGFDYLIFDRTTFVERGPDRLTVQTIPPFIYPASYPAWFFNRDKFVDFLGETYELLAEFDALSATIDLGDGYAHDRGLIFRRRGLAPGAHGA